MRLRFERRDTVEKKEKQPCWLARLRRALKRKHWDTDEEALQDAQVFIQASLAIIWISVLNIIWGIVEIVRCLIRL